MLVRHAFYLCALAISLGGFGCAETAQITQPPGTPHTVEVGPGGKPLPGAKSPAEVQFELALGEMMRLDRAAAWTPETCDHVAKEFLEAAGSDSDALSVHAFFNAGVARERCHDAAEAKKQFERALALKADFHQAKVHLILLRYRDNGAREIDKAIAEMRQAAIVDARYKNVEALVALAMLSLERGNSASDGDGPNDRARAVRYLQSALAVDDAYLPAMNGLALYYLDEARAHSGEKRARSGMSSSIAERSQSTQAMELAALVCSQAIRKDPNDAVIHNTYGLIQVELGNLGKAAEAFGKARSIRPGFYEAEMNFAAVNLQFRGFARAEEAYRAVLKGRPDDYDARVGLALALRGQIQDSNADTLVEQAQKELSRAKQIAPERPEAYFNEAILTQEYKARGAEGAEMKKQLEQAKSLFGQFVQKAGSAAQYAEAVKSAGERIREIDDVAKFLGTSAKNGS